MSYIFLNVKVLNIFTRNIFKVPCRHYNGNTLQEFVFFAFFPRHRELMWLSQGNVRQGILRGTSIHFPVISLPPKSKSTQFVKFNIPECGFMPLKSNFDVDFRLYDQYYS